MGVYFLFCPSHGVHFKAENRPTDSQKSDPLIAGKLSPNQLTINQLKENQRNRASGEPPATFGRYENIYLTETEYEELKQEIPGIDRLIEELSSYIQSEGRQYADHAATLRRWCNREKPKSGIPDYSFKEGESL